MNRNLSTQDIYAIDFITIIRRYCGIEMSSINGWTSECRPKNWIIQAGKREKVSSSIDVFSDMCPKNTNCQELGRTLGELKVNQLDVQFELLLSFSIFWFSLTCLTTVCEQSPMVAQLQLTASWTATSRTSNVNLVTYMNISLFGLGSTFAYQSYMSFGSARDLYCSCCWPSNEILVLTCS